MTIESELQAMINVRNIKAEEYNNLYMQLRKLAFEYVYEVLGNHGVQIGKEILFDKPYTHTFLSQKITGDSFILQEITTNDNYSIEHEDESPEFVRTYCFSDFDYILSEFGCKITLLPVNESIYIRVDELISLL